MQTEEIKKYLIKLGLPGRDNYGLPTSGKTFPDGEFLKESGCQDTRSINTLTCILFS